MSGDGSERPERLRILYCTSDFRGGGTQRHLLALARGLPASRFEITVACLSDRGELAGPMRETGARIERYPIEHALWHPRSLASVASLARRIRSGRFDLVHTLLGHANVVGLLAARLAGERRVIASQRSLHPVSGSFREASPAMVALARWLFRHVARRVVVNNPAIADDLRRHGLPEERVLLLPNGIDTDRFRPVADRDAGRREIGLDPGSAVVGFFGRMIPDKGLERVLEAAEHLAGRIPGLQLLGVGDGPEREHLERRAAAGPLGYRARFTGFRNDPERLYPLIDVLAFPSTYSEGTPNVVLEAMACGVPPVVHRMLQTEWMVKDGTTGLLVDGRARAPLADAIARLLEDPVRARQMGLAARAHVISAHSLPAMLETVGRLYEHEALR